MIFEKKPLIILTGPTAVGKTALSISLAKSVNGEIISADSMQAYRRMNIGSAKIRPEEMEGVPHYLIDVLEPTEEFNVVKFKKMALEHMNHIYQKGKIPILVGGTGFYLQAVLYDIDFTENDDNAKIRAQLLEYAKLHGKQALHERLRQVDAASADAIHYHNVKRVIRALEFYELTGMKISEHNEEQRQKESPFHYAYFVLNDDRKTLYQRIDRRVDQMMEQGLIDEVKALKEAGCTKEMTSMKGLGYKEMLDYLDGETSLEEAVFILKRDTRHFAKRQITWHKRERDVIWLSRQDYRNEQEILEKIRAELLKRQIITI